MSSEAITQNDLREILSRTVGAVPSEYRKLLWINANTGAAFVSQTVVSGDLTQYDAFEIIMQASLSTTQAGYSNIMTRGSKGTWVTGSAPSVNDSWYGIRRITITDSAITFGNGGYYYFNGSQDLNNNNYGIPVAIYGIKYERVQPPILDAEIEALTTGATLYRIGRMRMLVLNDFAYGTTIQTLASTDRPSNKAVGVGTRHNGGAYITFARMEVNTNGNLALYDVGSYNTSSGYINPGSGDIFNVTAIWYVAE